MLQEVYIGPKLTSNGNSLSGLTGERSSALRTADAHGRYQDLCLNGNYYTLSTAVAGVTIAAANVFSAANPQPLVGWNNPVSSKFNISILIATAVWNSGTPGAGGLVWAVSKASVGLTAQGAQNLSLNNFTFGLDGITNQFVNTAMSGITMTLLRSMGGPSAIAIASGNLTVIEETAARIIIPPGASCGLFAGAAGTSPIVNASAEYELIPV